MACLYPNIVLGDFIISLGTVVRVEASLVYYRDPLGREYELINALPDFAWAIERPLYLRELVEVLYAR